MFYTFSCVLQLYSVGVLVLRAIRAVPVTRATSPTRMSSRLFRGILKPSEVKEARAGMELVKGLFEVPEGDSGRYYYTISLPKPG